MFYTILEPGDKTAFRIILRQSAEVRFSPEGCLAVLFVLRYAKPFWIHKVMIQRVKD